MSPEKIKMPNYRELAISTFIRKQGAGAWSGEGREFGREGKWGLALSDFFGDGWKRLKLVRGADSASSIAPGAAEAPTPETGGC